MLRLRYKKEELSGSAIVLTGLAIIAVLSLLYLNTTVRCRSFGLLQVVNSEDSSPKDEVKKE